MKKTIAVTINAHESEECLLQLLENIMNYFDDFDIVFVISITENIYKPFLKLINEKNAHNIHHYITTIRPLSIPFWGHQNLFHSHMLNLNYLITNNISFDYFLFVDSNELYIKPIPKTLVESMDHYKKLENSKYKNIDLDDYWNDYKEYKINRKWCWTKFTLKDSYFSEVFQRNKMKVKHQYNNGTILPKNIIVDIFELYMKENIIEKSTFKNYPMEEIWIHSYLDAYYNEFFINLSNVFTEVYVGDKITPEHMIETTMKNNTKFSIKPVKRDINDTLRKTIMNK